MSVDTAWQPLFNSKLARLSTSLHRALDAEHLCEETARVRLRRLTVRAECPGDGGGCCGSLSRIRQAGKRRRAVAALGALDGMVFGGTGMAGLVWERERKRERGVKLEEVQEVVKMDADGGEVVQEGSEGRKEEQDLEDAIRDEEEVGCKAELTENGKEREEGLGKEGRAKEDTSSSRSSASSVPSSVSSRSRYSNLGCVSPLSSAETLSELCTSAKVVSCIKLEKAEAGSRWRIPKLSWVFTQRRGA